MRRDVGKDILFHSIRTPNMGLDLDLELVNFIPNISFHLEFKHKFSFRIEIDEFYKIEIKKYIDFFSFQFFEN